MASIKVTPEELSVQGNDLVGYAGDLSDILTAINSKVEEIIDSWDGLAQDAYYSMYETMKESLDQFPTLVESLGTATVSSAEAFASVDEELQSAFNNA